MVRRACIIAHYDRDNVVDEYVYYYLSHISNVAEKIVFVTVSQLGESDLKRMTSMGVSVICRNNIGYDFFSYKLGLESINVEDYDEIIVCNDSVYGPFFDLNTTFSKMEKRGCDFWGATDSNEINYHLQSYFLVFKSQVIKSLVFKEFWSSIAVLADKNEIIATYEVGLSQALLSKGYVFEALYPVEKVNTPYRRLVQVTYSFRESLGRVFMKDFYQDFFRKLGSVGKINPNTTITFWKDVLLDGRSPFLKVSVVRDESFKNDDFVELGTILSSISEYPFSLIKNHHDRIKLSG